MGDSVVYGLVGAAAGIVGAAATFATFWMTISSRITKAQATADSGVAIGKDARMKAEAVARDLALFEKESAKEFVTGHALDRVKDEITARVGEIRAEIRDDIAQVTARLDRLVAVAERKG